MKRASRNDAHTALVNACLQVLWLRRVFAWKQNTGCMKVGNRFIRFAPKGTPDILGYLPSGRGLAVECKTGDARPNKDQKAWHKNARRCNVIVAVVGDVLDLIDVLEKEAP